MSVQLLMVSGRPSSRSGQSLGFWRKFGILLEFGKSRNSSGRAWKSSKGSNRCLGREEIGEELTLELGELNNKVSFVFLDSKGNTHGKESDLSSTAVSAKALSFSKLSSKRASMSWTFTCESKKNGFASSPSVT